jgi:predicted transcriptional regulator
MLEEAAEIEEAFAEIDAGKGVKAEDVWKELGI